ncbi:MAG: hypothetical protein NWR47_02845 [Aestuariivirgaceae bacterium]|nr:hypothetical protein [Aestuariivirgaceae bacterium]
MRIAVLGAGAVGLSTAGRLAVLGHETLVIDKDARRIASLCNGRLPFVEPGLEALLTAAAVAGNLEYGVDAASGLRGMQACLIAVGTPEKHGEPSPVLVRHAAEECARFAPGDCLAVIRSSLMVGSCAALEALHGREFVPHPEMAVRGQLAQKPARLLAGTLRRPSRDMLSRIYAELAPVAFAPPHEVELRGFSDFRRARDMETETEALRLRA